MNENILFLITWALSTILIIQLDSVYPRKFNYFGIYYAWALNFWTFLFVVKWLRDLVSLEDKLDGINIMILWISNINEYKKFIPITESNWVSSGWLHIDWHFNIGIYEILMLSIVTFISTMVQLYSMNYMIFDDYKRFTTYIMLFTLFMILLVSAGNFLILFLGWEGVGLCSYLLINFWYTRVNANLAAIKALIVNRIADMGLIVGIILIYLTFLSLDFEIVLPLIPFFLDETIYLLNYEIDTIELIGILIFIGAMGKSAQLGLHTWLPDAMEGPTPVSALIHAATMVTAGVFLVIKCSTIFEYIPRILNIIVFVGAFTAFFSALIGLVQNDIKKIIAYSTCSQLGYMIFCCGLSAYDVSFFHLINHAFFKALLFLSAGSIIHSSANEQDLRKYGFLIRDNSPFLYVALLIGSLALMGFPFLTGFYSKDLILELAFIKYTVVATFSYLLGTTTAFFTAIYSCRIIYLVFFFKNNIFRRFLNYETSIFFLIPLSFLTLGSLIFGFFLKDFFIGFGTPTFEKNIFIAPSTISLGEAEFFGWDDLPFFKIQCKKFELFPYSDMQFNRIIHESAIPMQFGLRKWSIVDNIPLLNSVHNPKLLPLEVVTDMNHISLILEHKYTLQQWYELLTKSNSYLHTHLDEQDDYPMPYTVPEEDETLQAIIWRELMIPALFPKTLFSDQPQIAEYALKLEGFTEFLEFEVQVPSEYMYYNCFQISLQKWWIKLIPFWLINLALIMVVFLNNIHKFVIFEKKTQLYLLLSKKFFFDIFYNKFLINGNIFLFGYHYIYKYMDKILLEFIGPATIYQILYLISLKLRAVHSGIIFIYILYFLIVFGLIVIVPLQFNDLFNLF